MLNNIAFCQVAISLDLRGENGVFSPHADSGMQAMVEAAAVLGEGRAQAVVAGGVSEAVSPASLARARLNGLMPAAGEDAAAPGRPFAANRNGTVLGEGCAMVVLERQAAAQGRGAHCLARISGWGHACEIVAPSSPAAQANAVARAMHSALEHARARPADIDVLIAHGDGTREGDGNEIVAIHQTFAGSLDQLKVFSSKGALGHLLAAAPAVDVILGALMIARQKIPATINAEPADGAVRFHLVTGRPSPAKVRKVMINARSHEGPCASLIIETVD
jgi:3-oxoacyl-[acyl-carrier-protein] synthase II